MMMGGNIPVMISLSDDSILECTENVTITIMDTGECTLASPDTIVLSVEDNDGEYIQCVDTYI